jgi:two-component system, probable response regulator PhcQ
LSQRTLLLVDDEPPILHALHRSLRHGLRGLGLTLDLCTDPREAARRICSREYALVMSDYRMPGLTGVELLTRVRVVQPLAGRIVLSGQVDRDGLVAAINEARIHRFVAKPWDDEELARTVQQVLAQPQPPSAQELERQRLELLEPGITHVDWEPDGSLRLDLLEDAFSG